MKPKQQQIAIAKACGWTYDKNETHAPDKAFWWSEKPDFPDYLHDLNAMHKAEKIISDVFVRRRYYQHLDAITGDQWNTIVATAAQRAEAFLRTLGLWDNN